MCVRSILLRTQGVRVLLQGPTGQRPEIPQLCQGKKSRKDLKFHSSDWKMQLTFSCSVTVWPIAFPFTFTCTGTNACRTTDSDFYKSLIKAKHCISYKMILFRMILFNTCNEDCVVNSLYLWFQKCNNDSLLLQKREIPDFVLLVTQRPSKYLGLLDTLIKRTTG